MEEKTKEILWDEYARAYNALAADMEERNMPLQGLITLGKCVGKIIDCLTGGERSC